MWKKWGRKYKSKKQQLVYYACVVATVYHIWRIRNPSYWNEAVLRPEILIKQIQADITIRVRARINDKWRIEDLDWLNNPCIEAR